MKLIMIVLLSVRLFAWQFLEEDFDKLSPQQIQIIEDSIRIGNTVGLGLELAAIVVVETRAGQYLGNSQKICGAHQLNVFIQKTKLGSTSPSINLCNYLNHNHKYSAHLALSELKYWLRHSNGITEAILKYNRGWKAHPYDSTYKKRFNQSLNTLRNEYRKEK